jgi:hypothetical protein
MRIVFVLAAALMMAAPAVAQPGDWQISRQAGGCSVGKAGAEVNTRLLRNQSGKMILIAARPDWTGDEPADIQLAIDGGAALTLQAQKLGPLALVLIEDAALETELRAARTLTWTTPWGVFNAQVEGLGEAFDALSRC